MFLNLIFDFVYEIFQFFPSYTWHHTSSTLHMCNFRMQNIQNSHFSFALSMWKILAIVTVDRRMNANFLPPLYGSKCGWHIDHEKWCVVKPNFEKPNTMDHQARKFKKWYLQWSTLLPTTPFIRFASDYPCWWHIFLLLIRLCTFIYEEFLRDMKSTVLRFIFSSHYIDLDGRVRRTALVLRWGWMRICLKILIYPAGNSSYERFVYIIQRTHPFNMRSN